MKLRFWGVRGSIPVPEADKFRIGGNTSCVELDIGLETRLIFDAGTGIRTLGMKLVKEIEAGKVKELIILLSHYHWDHIQGFPFFAPAYIPKFKIHIFGPAKANRTLERIFSSQMEYDYWPVKFSQLTADIKFYELKEGTHLLREGIRVEAKRHIHPGTAFGYRISRDGKTVVYSTDTEHFQNRLDKRVVDIAQDADLLIHDGQYTDNEIEFKLGWGHSTWRQAVEVAIEAKVKKLALFHMDPNRSDDEAEEIEKEAKKIFPNSFLAREQMVIEI